MLYPTRTLGLEPAPAPVNVAGGAAAIINPLVSAGFDIHNTGMETKYAGKRFLLDQRRAKLLNQPFLPAARQGKSPLKMILIFVAVIIALVVGLGVLASSTATSSSKTGIITKGGKRFKRVRRRSRPKSRK